MSAGRPIKFKNSQELQDEIDLYFSNCPDIVDVDGRKVSVPTISGLCFFLGFESRQSFYDYEKLDEFSYTIKRARLQIEMRYEQRLHTSQCSGAIFALKNFGWTDRQQIEHSGEIDHEFGGVEELGQRVNEKLDRVLDGIGTFESGQKARRGSKKSPTMGAKQKK